jgi:hypothetical protein
MALTPTTAKGTVGLMMESAGSGFQPILAATPIASSITGLTALTGSTGMRLYIRITNWTTAGTISVSGTGIPASTEGPYTVAAPTAQQVQSPQLASFDLVTTNVYATGSSPTITTTGMANAIVAVYGIQGPKYGVPVTAFKSDRKVPEVSPLEHNGRMARDNHLIATQNETTIDTFDSDFYPDTSLYWPELMIGIPSWTTIPATPTALFPATALASTQSLTTQPTAPSMKLVLTVTSFTVAGTITLNGTSWGIPTSEIISITGNGTYYSANSYTAIATNGIVNATTAATLAIGGIFCFQGIVNEEAVRATAAVEFFDGSASWVHPFSAMTEGDITITAKGEAKLTLKGIAQDKLAIGDRTTNPLQVNRTVALANGAGDVPIAGWQTVVYIDPITGTPQTTVLTDADEEIKISIKAPVEPHWTFNNQQPFTRAYPGKPECTATMTYDVLNLLQNEQFRQNLKQYLVVAMIGRYVGTSSGTAYYEGWTWTLPGRYDGSYGQEGDPGKANPFAKPTWRTEYDAGIGGTYQLKIITQQPPTYNS